MIKSLLRFLSGYYVLCIPEKYASLTINLLRERNDASWGYSLADGNFFLRVKKSGYLFLQEKITGPSILCVEKKGIPFFLFRHRSHIGLVCGAFFALLLVLFSFSVVWDVRIEGNELQSDQQVVKTLEEAGLKIGERIRGLDTKDIANRALLSDPRFSFISVNLRGCVAYVTVRETQKGDITQESKGPAELIASCDGLIESLAVERGEILVQAGQVVKAGEVLVSGMQNGLSGATPVRAEGAVYARINRTFSVAVPSVVENKIPQKRKIRDFSLLFWGKSVNIYRNTGNLPSEYDTIYEKDFFYTQYDVRLPFGYLCTSVLPYEKGSRDIGETEQIALALSRLEEEMTRALQGG